MNPLNALDVVVVNYNAGNALAACLSEIVNAEKLAIRMVVVDNNSTDESLSNLKSSIDVSQIKIFKNSSNLGFAKACNQGANHGESEYIAFINPDCFINSKGLLKLTHALKTDKQAGIIGCRVLNNDGSLQAASRRRLPTLIRIVFHLLKLWRIPGLPGININDDGVFTKVQSVEAVNGACIVVERTCFTKIGGFDEGYPLHFEDLDLFARVQKKGLKVLYHPAVEARHLKGQSSTNKQQIKAWKRQGLVRYLSKHRPAWEARIAKFMLGVK